MEPLLPLAILGLAMFIEELLRIWYTSSTLIRRSTMPVTTSASVKPQTLPPESESIVWVKGQDSYGQYLKLASASTLREHGKKARAHSSGI
jgi:hypothetical protein